MRKKLNDGLRQKQEELRQETLEKVEEAIDDLQNEGYEITTKLLLERTGLSRSTFSKPHVVQLLKEKRVGRFKSVKKLPDEDLIQVNANLQKEIKKLENENMKLKTELDKEIQKNVKMQVGMAEKEDEIQTLRGQLMNLYRRASLKGVSLDD